MRTSIWDYLSGRVLVAWYLTTIDQGNRARLRILRHRLAAMEVLLGAIEPNEWTDGYAAHLRRKRDDVLRSIAKVESRLLCPAS